MQGHKHLSWTFSPTLPLILGVLAISKLPWLEFQPSSEGKTHWTNNHVPVVGTVSEGSLSKQLNSVPSLTWNETHRGWTNAPSGLELGGRGLGVGPIHWKRPLTTKTEQNYVCQDLSLVQPHSSLSITHCSDLFPPPPSPELKPLILLSTALHVLNSVTSFSLEVPSSPFAMASLSLRKM